MDKFEGVGVLNQLTAITYNSGFPEAHDTYNALTTASDGKIYYVLSSDQIHVGGKMYLYNPETNQTEFLGDLTEICGESGQNFIPQGKSHTRFYERNGARALPKLRFAKTLSHIPSR